LDEWESTRVLKSVLTANGLTIVICSSVAGIVAMLFAGRKS